MRSRALFFERARMSWADIGRQIANVAPVLGTALSGPAGGAVGALVSSLFGGASPEDVQKQIAADPEALVKLQALEFEHREELRRMVLQAETTRLTEVNATMRAEYAQDDKYVKRWRPTFGYAVTLTWTLQCLGIVAGMLYAIVYRPANSGDILTAIAAIVGALSVQWGVALSVLGISVQQRSKDKQLAAGFAPAPGVFSAIAQRFAGGKR
jgi:uncharacterized membrane protein YeaQ/YmgE (transglycosylase-associated protein family)